MEFVEVCTRYVLWLSCSLLPDAWSHLCGRSYCYCQAYTSASDNFYPFHRMPFIPGDPSLRPWPYTESSRFTK